MPMRIAWKAFRFKTHIDRNGRGIGMIAPIRLGDPPETLSSLHPLG